MTTPPAFTALTHTLLTDTMNKEISALTAHNAPSHRAFTDKMMVRVTLPPLAMWAVLYACVEYFM
jgi:hypothetical protein